MERKSLESAFRKMKRKSLKQVFEESETEVALKILLENETEVTLKNFLENETEVASIFCRKMKQKSLEITYEIQASFYLMQQKIQYISDNFKV